jgi:hypothetical protein
MIKRILVSLTVAFCLVLVTGCTNNGDTTGENPTKTPSPKASNLKDTPVECDWTLKVDQTIPVTTDGMTVNYTLILEATKNGGFDVLGNYKGTASIKVSLDASNLSNEVIQVTGGFSMKASTDNLSFEIVPYDIESYSHFGVGEGEIPVAPLVKYESMALLSPVMTGSGVLNPLVQGVQGEKAEVNESVTGTEAVPMRITVMSGKIRVDIPSFKIGKSFEGMLLGSPLK